MSGETFCSFKRNCSTVIAAFFSAAAKQFQVPESRVARNPQIRRHLPALRTRVTTKVLEVEKGAGLRVGNQRWGWWRMDRFFRRPRSLAASEPAPGGLGLGGLPGRISHGQHRFLLRRMLGKKVCICTDCQLQCFARVSLTVSFTSVASLSLFPRSLASGFWHENPSLPGRVTETQAAGSPWLSRRPSARGSGVCIAFPPGTTASPPDPPAPR